MRDRAKMPLCLSLVGAALVAGGIVISSGQVQADDPNSRQNHGIEHSAKLPEGRVWGQPLAVEIDRDGTSLWVFDRCAAKSCNGSEIPPIQKFDAAGRLVVSFGSGLFSWLHGLFAAADGTVWVTDGEKQVVLQFAPDGRVLKTLGRPGVAGNGPRHFQFAVRVVVAPNGDIFVRRPWRFPGQEYQRSHRQIFARWQIPDELGSSWV